VTEFGSQSLPDSTGQLNESCRDHKD
jgi:hypothetical protein